MKTLVRGNKERHKTVSAKAAFLIKSNRAFISGAALKFFRTSILPLSMKKLSSKARSDHSVHRNQIFDLIKET